MDRYADENVVITGGSGGIGLATVDAALQALGALER